MPQRNNNIFDPSGNFGISPSESNYNFEKATEIVYSQKRNMNNIKVSFNQEAPDQQHFEFFDPINKSRSLSKEESGQRNINSSIINNKFCTPTTSSPINIYGSINICEERLGLGSRSLKKNALSRIKI